MDKHAPLITKSKTKKSQSLVQQRFTKAQNPMKDGWEEVDQIKRTWRPGI